MVKTFGKKIKSLRKEKDLTQEFVAKAIPMNQSNYSKIERGVQEPNLKQLVALCNILSASADELLGLNDQASNNILEDNVEKISDGIGQ
jgi:transcriptional regulator with XRE-family HTH domain